MVFPAKEFGKDHSNQLARGQTWARPELALEDAEVYKCCGPVTSPQPTLGTLNMNKCIVPLTSTNGSLWLLM